jgi:hypothetical protein
MGINGPINNNMTYQQQPTFDWTTNIDDLIGPVPSISDFHPIMPLQPVHTLPAPTDCTPAAYTPTVSVTVSTNPDHILTTLRDMAPSPNGVVLISTTPTEPTLVNISQDTSVSLPNSVPTVLPKHSPIALAATILLITYEPCDFLAFRLSKQNP